MKSKRIKQAIPELLAGVQDTEKSGLTALEIIEQLRSLNLVYRAADAIGISVPKRLVAFTPPTTAGVMPALYELEAAGVVESHVEPPEAPADFQHRVYQLVPDPAEA